MKSSRWPSAPIRRLGTIVGGGTPTADPSHWGGDIPFVTPPDLRPVVGGVVHHTERTLSAKGAAAGSAIVPAESVLLSIRAPIGYVARTGAVMAFNQGCRAIVPFDGMSASYLTYSLMAAASELASLGRGTTFMELSASQMASLELPAPSLADQLAVADYLERETARIDTLIEEQQRLIEMLSERRVATIAEALEGYDSITLRRLVDRQRPMTYGILQAGEPVDGGVPYIGPSDITGEGSSPKKQALRTTAAEIASAYSRSVLAGGDVVVSIGPAYGKVAVVSSDLAGANLTQDTVRVALKPELADTRFVVWALLSRRIADYWDYQIMGATFRRLNLGTLARTPIPLAPLGEQRRIATYLDEQTVKIDTLIVETERFIELSKERRAALITAAVTGLIDVTAAA